jgi:hypothetical protein
MFKMTKTIYQKPDLRLKKQKPSMRFTTRKAKPEMVVKNKPLQQKFRKKHASDLLTNSSYNNPLMKLQNDMITNLSDLTKRSSRFGSNSNMAIPVMRQESSLLGGYGLERATNASSLFGTNSVFSDYNKQLNAQRHFIAEKEEEERGMFSSKAVSTPPMKPHKQKDPSLGDAYQNMYERKARETQENHKITQGLVYDIADKAVDISNKRAQRKANRENNNNTDDFMGDTDAMFMTPEKQNKEVFIDDEPTIEPTTGKEKEAKAKEDEQTDLVSGFLSKDGGDLNIGGKTVKATTFKEGKVKGSYIIKGKFSVKGKKLRRSLFYEVSYNPSKNQFEPIRMLSAANASKAIKQT